ncbi:MAG: dihydrofolate reductase [bacterium]
MIACISSNRAIGKDNKLLFHINEDMAFFKRMTMGSIVIMGRKNWESIPIKFRPLPGRINIILTRQTDYDANQDLLTIPEEIQKNILVCTSLVDVKTTIMQLQESTTIEEVFVIGGSEIYQLFLDYIDTVYLSIVDQEVEGDSFFPVLDSQTWQHHQIDNYPSSSIPFRIEEWRRKL